jgi:hypothetical protein
MPMSAFLALSSGMSEKAVVDIHVARLLGASLVVGDPDKLNRLKVDEGVLNEARARVAVAVSGQTEAAAEWFATGERGSSSDAMFYRLAGVGRASVDAPSDVDDLRRCRLLLEQVPELRSRLPDMADVSDEWSRLVSHWPRLCALMDGETPDWRHCRGAAPKTYKAMKALLSALPQSAPLSGDGG